MPLRTFILFFCILLVITLLDFFYLGKPVVGIDDANISMNYAWHLSKGEGFVFNHGGEKVEGFTSLLWVLIIRCFYALSSHPEKLMMGFLFFLSVITIYIVYIELQKEVAERYPAVSNRKFLWVYCLFVVCIAPPYLLWSVLSLMENGVWNFILTAMVILLLRLHRGDNKSSTKFFLVVGGVLLLLTRPEAMVWSALFTVLLWMIARKNRAGYIFPLLFFTVMVLTTAALTVFRERYFGYPFPNTYYAKVSGDELYNLKEGFLYLFRFLTNYHPIVTFLLGILLVYLISRQYESGSLKKVASYFRVDDENGPYRIITFIILVILVLPMTTGGDHFGGFRFYQASLLFFAWALPPLVSLAERNVNGTMESLKVIGGAAAFTFLLYTAGSLYRLKNLTETRMDFEFSLASSGRWDAVGLNRFWKDHKPSVGVITVGGFSLKYEGETVDLMGLNNTLMGHSKGDRRGIKNHAAFNKEVFYRLQPDMLLPKVVNNEAEARSYYEELEDESNFSNQALRHIFYDSTFTSMYHPVLMQKNDQKVFAFVKRDLESKVAEDTIRLTQLRLQ